MVLGLDFNRFKIQQAKTSLFRFKRHRSQLREEPVVALKTANPKSRISRDGYVRGLGGENW